MAIKFRVSVLSPELVTEVEVLRETKHCVFLKSGKARNGYERPIRESKASKTHRYYDSLSSVIIALRIRSDKQLAEARSNLASATSFAARVDAFIAERSGSLSA